MEIYDISQTLQEGMPVWPGDPEFRREPWLQKSKGGLTNLSALRIGTHTGTHVDAPLHLEDSATDVAEIPIQGFIGPVRVMEILGRESIRAADLASLDWSGVERVLFKTRSSPVAETAFDPNFTFLGEDASELLAGKRLLLVGIDAPSVDFYSSPDLRSHKILIRAGITILEGIRLGSVPAGDYNLACLPLKIARGDGSPVRAILWRSGLTIDD